VSIAAGPVGRNAEAAGAASLKGVAGIFAYSKTKGLFAGVSLEGSAIIERRDANEKLYNRRVTARALLEGQVPHPPDAEPLMRVLNARAFSGAGAASAAGDAIYNDIPVYDDAHEDVVWQGRRGSAMGEGNRSSQLPTSPRSQDPSGWGERPSRASTWQDDLYDRPSPGVNRSSTFGSRANPNETFDSLQGRGSSGSAFDNNGFSDKPKPSRPTAPKPLLTGAARKASMGPNQAIAKFTFDGEQSGDLSFKKGEIITILKRTDNETDWWTGRVGTKEGIFPR
jgi:hypothetical protein